MLADMTPQEFDERWAHWLVEPWGKEMEVFSAVGAAIINTVRQGLASEQLKENDLLPLDFFLPKRESETPQPEYKTSDFLAVMRQRIGV